MDVGRSEVARLSVTGLAVGVSLVYSHVSIFG